MPGYFHALGKYTAESDRLTTPSRETLRTAFLTSVLSVGFGVRIVITYTILTAVAICTIYLLTKMVKSEKINCATAPAGLQIYRRMLYGGLLGSILAYSILALIQPDLFWAIFNPRKVSTVTQGMTSRSFYIMGMSCASIFIGGIPGSIIALLSRKWQDKQIDKQKTK